MNARDLADLIHAERVSKSKWIANCPAHDDHDLQLTITDVAGGPAQVRCSQNCTVRHIVFKIGIYVQDLLSVPEPEIDIEDTDSDEAVAYLLRTRNRQEQHDILCGQLRRKRRAITSLEDEICRAEEAHGLVCRLESARSDLKRLQKLEKKWRA